MARGEILRAGVKIRLIALICIALVAVSLAYMLMGPKWPVGTNVGYYTNPNTLQVPNEEDAVRSAAISWSQINPAGLRLSYIGSTSETTYGFNGLNTICWQNEGNTPTLATSYIWWSSQTIVETDMVFNDYHSWSTSGSNFDIETVALHEFGHWVGLAHSSTGIMRPSYGGIQRSIDSDARAGFEAMYGTGPSNQPWIELDPTSLSFSGSGEKTFRVRNSGEGTLNYQIGTDKSWLGVTPTNGSSTGEWDLVAASVDVSGLNPGNYSGSITVSSADAANSPQGLSVLLTFLKDSPPTVSIISPGDGDVVNKIVTIKVSASDDKGINEVEFYIDNILKNKDTSSPFEWGWDTGNYSSGFHSIKAKAYDTIGQTAEAQIRVKVDKPPQVSIQSPAPEASVFSIVSIKTSASDDFGIKKVQFFIDDVLQLTDNSSPYEYSWDTSPLTNGNYNLKVVVTDLVGQTAEHAITVYMLPHPPLNFSGFKQNNSSALLEQYIIVLSWQANNLNKDIIKYRLYLREGDNWTMLVELDGNALGYWHWGVEKEKKYAYVIRAFDARGREGESAQVDVQ